MRNVRLMKLAAILVLSQQLPGQTGYQVVNSWNFESETISTYEYAEVLEDFHAFAFYPHGKEYIVNDMINGVTTKVIKALHDPGEYYDGFQLNSFFNESETPYDEIYMSYNIKFGEEWNSTSGGKLPGIRGFPLISIPPADEQGFYYAPIFHPGNRLVAYHYDRTRSNGAENPWAVGPTYGDVYFSNGTWYNVTQRVVKNTFTNGVPNADGINEIWVNGKLIYQETGLRILALESKGIDGFFLGNYYGGGSIDYLPLHQCDIYLDNVVIWIPTNDPTYGSRGLHNSSEILETPAMITDRKLYYDQLITYQGQFNNSEYGQTYSPCIDEAYLIDAGQDKTVNFEINNYSIGTEDFLFFYDGNTTDARLIKNIKGSATGNNEIINSTGRYLFIRFSTNTYDESTGWTGTISFSNGSETGDTFADLPPEAPSSLKVDNFTENSISISWKDNSTNEEAFIITRSPVANPDEVVEINAHANDTSYTDDSLNSGTTYTYFVKAANHAGNSNNSNKKIVATMSLAETKRIRTGLIAYYNFEYNPDLIVYDVSGFGEPINLGVPKTSSVYWEKDEKLSILGNTELISLTYANKITDALKETNEITFECWIKPKEPDFTGKSRIFTLGNSDADLGFALDQYYIVNNDQKSLIYSTRFHTASTNESGYPELIMDNSSSYINMYHVIYIRDKEGIESIYINGVKSAESFRPGDLNIWENNYNLKLGNDSNINPWKGSFYIVALYNNALTKEQVLQNYNAGPKDDVVNKGMKYNINLFPNPVANSATIEIVPQTNVDIVAPTALKIFNTYGKLLYQENLFDPYNQYSKTIDFQNLTSGLYIMQIISGEEKQSLRLIKE